MAELIQSILTLTFGALLVSFCASIAIKKTLALSYHLRISEFAISFILIGVLAVFPEMLIGVLSALENTSSFGAGVVIGSNIADLTLIIGLVALATNGMKLSTNTINGFKRIVLLSSLPLIFFLDGELSKIEGLALVLCFAFYLFFVLKKHTISVEKPDNFYKKDDLLKDAAILLLMIIIMVISSHFIIESTKSINVLLGIPVFFIGVILAVVTCFPEFTVALKANKHRHGEIGFGDIIGNVFADSLLTLGVIAMISPIVPAKPYSTLLALFIMLFAMTTLLVLARSEKEISKDEGAFLVGIYFLLIIIQYFLGVETH
ncbi:MAG: hypothetical protein QXS90_00025 [Candidatus Diapherotrites archaeon]